MTRVWGGKGSRIGGQQSAPVESEQIEQVLAEIARRRRQHRYQPADAATADLSKQGDVMRRLMVLMMIVGAANALAYDDEDYKPRRPRSSSSYDANTGNMYNTHRHTDGSSDTYGMNPNTGSQWSSRTDRRGNSSGTDADGNMWQHNKDTNTYYNYGTGKMCTGSGYSRICN